MYLSLKQFLPAKRIDIIYNGDYCIFEQGAIYVYFGRGASGPSPTANIIMTCTVSSNIIMTSMV